LINVVIDIIINRADYSTMKRSFGKGMVVTKDTFLREENIAGIPASVFLLLGT